LLPIGPIDSNGHDFYDPYCADGQIWLWIGKKERWLENKEKEGKKKKMVDERSQLKRHVCSCRTVHQAWWYGVGQSSLVL